MDQSSIVTLTASNVTVTPIEQLCFAQKCVRILRQTSCYKRKKHTKMFALSAWMQIAVNGVITAEPIIINVNIVHSLPKVNFVSPKVLQE